MLIPAALRELAIIENLPFEIVMKLVQIPRRAKELGTVGEWRNLYFSVKQYLEDA
jgi:hypothetical protein